MKNDFLQASLMVAGGGALGSLMRYWVNLAAYRSFSPSFPLGTLIVNVLGCFLIGLIFSLAEKSSLLSTNIRLFLMVGICGGFTTFSSFSIESINLLRAREIWFFFLNMGAQVFLGLAATVVGLLLGSFLVKQL